MNIIINPWFIYLLSVVDSIKTLLGFLILISLCVSVFLFIFALSEKVSGYSDDETVEVCFRYAKILVVICIVSTILQIFTPNKNTLITIYATKYITVDNIRISRDAIIGTISEVANIIKEKEKN